MEKFIHYFYLFFKIILLVIPIGIIIFLIIIKSYSSSFKENAATAEAEVIDIIKEVSKGGRRRVYYYPVVKYKLTSGKEITTTCYKRVGFGNRKYILHEKIIIHYKLDDPQDIAFYEGDMDTMYMLFIIIVLIIMGFMIYQFFIKNKI